MTLHSPFPFGRRALAAALLAAAGLAGGCSQSNAPDADGDAAAPAADASAAQPQSADAESESETDAETEIEIDDIEVPIISAAEVGEKVRALEGKTVVVNFWATWCLPCVEEMPELAEFYEEKDDASVEFVSITADDKSRMDEAVKPFIVEHELPFPVYLVDAMPDAIVEELEVGDWAGGSLPATFVYGPDGALEASWFEAITLEQLTEAVAEASA